MGRSRGLVAVVWTLLAGAVGTSCGEASSSRGRGSGGASSLPSAGGAGGADAGLDSGGLNPLLCGNGVVDVGEECDDANSDNNDGCNSGCHFTCTVERQDCDDHIICNGPETCGPDHRCLPSSAPLPDGTICGESDRCVAGDCKRAAPLCGDGLVVKPDEECEDGNTVDGDGCDNCRFSCALTDPPRDCSSNDPCPG